MEVVKQIVPEKVVALVLSWLAGDPAAEIGSRIEPSGKHNPAVIHAKPGFGMWQLWWKWAEA